MKRFVFYLIIVLMVFNLAGCWNRRELDQLAIVQGIGIDLLEDDKLQITLQILKPKGLTSGGGGGSGGNGGSESNLGVWIASSEGETLFEAMRRATALTDRRLFSSHNKVVIFGEDLAKKGIKPLLDFLRRDPETRMISSCFVARGKAEDILKATHEQEDVPAEAILGLAEGTVSTSQYPKDNEMLHLITTIESGDKDPIVAGIDTVTSKDPEKQDKLVHLSDTAVFKHDKLVGWFTPEETRGVLWILGDIESGIIILESPINKKDKISVEIISATSKIKPQLKDDKLSILVQIYVTGNIGENLGSQSIVEPEIFEKIKRELEIAVINEIEPSLKKAQNWGVDVFGFGEMTHKKLPKTWSQVKENWPQEFKDLEVTIEVHGELVGIGTLLKPIQ